MSVIRRQTFGRGSSDGPGSAVSSEIFDIELPDRMVGINNEHRDAMDDRTKLIPTSEPNTAGHDDISASYGKPSRKPRFDVLNFAAVLASFVSLMVAIAMVAVHRVAWRLGYNQQLQLAGILLAIMSICLSFLAQQLFVLVEVRFGRSTIQNVDGLLRKSFLGDRLDFSWRSALVLMLVISSAFEFAYKDSFFRHGTSSISADRTTMRDTLHDVWPSGSVLDLNAGLDRYGMFGPCGTHLLGGNTGLSLLTNATLPFLNASNSPFASTYYYVPYWNVNTSAGTEPPMPVWPRAYAFNTLVLDDHRTAMLDAPNPDWVSAIRASLSIGDSWNLTAHVWATVAAYTGPASTDSLFDQFCAEAVINGSVRRQDLDVGASVILAESAFGSNVLYFGYMKNKDDNATWDCSAFKSIAMRYDLSRRPCEGQWTLTRGGGQLIAGTCLETPIDPEKQTAITYFNNQYTLFYPVQLGESLGPFATTRFGAPWLQPSTNTMIAAMAWSRLTSLFSAADNRIATFGRVNSLARAIEWHLLYTADSVVPSTRCVDRGYSICSSAHSPS